MARKPNVSATSRAATAYSEYTGRYRQSENIEDRRKGLAPSQAAEISSISRRPNSNDEVDDGSYGGFDKIPKIPSDPNKTPAPRSAETATPNTERRWNRSPLDTRVGSGSTGQERTWGPDVNPTDTGVTRKVDPEEAIQATHRDRK